MENVQAHKWHHAFLCIENDRELHDNIQAISMSYINAQAEALANVYDLSTRRSTVRDRAEVLFLDKFSRISLIIKKILADCGIRAGYRETIMGFIHAVASFKYDRPACGKLYTDYYNLFNLAFSNNTSYEQPIDEDEDMKLCEIKTVTYVNGNDVKNMKDEDVIAVITNTKAEIEKLESLPVRPKRIEKQLTQLRADLDAFIALIDSLE